MGEKQRGRERKGEGRENKRKWINTRKNNVVRKEERRGDETSKRRLGVSLWNSTEANATCLIIDRRHCITIYAHSLLLPPHPLLTHINTFQNTHHTMNNFHKCSMMITMGLLYNTKLQYNAVKCQWL